MAISLFDADFQTVFDAAKKSVGQANGPFPSPPDWRDQWIYFLIVDRFNNPAGPPVHLPFDDPDFVGYQGGTYAGIRQQLQYIKSLGAGAIWLSPVLENMPFDNGSYHGYGIHNFLSAERRFATVPASADDELRALVDAAHEAGLYVIFDIVLNHVGGPIGIGAYAGKHKDVFPGWATSIKALAACPNVYVKLGGLGMRMGGFGFHERPEPPSSEALANPWRPYIETCIDAFSPSRCMFESNFPVDKGSYSYPVFWNACKLLAKGASDNEKADLFSATAARFYRLDLPR